MPNSLSERISNIPEVDADELDAHLISQAEISGVDEPVSWDDYKTKRKGSQYTKVELKAAI